jgi:hypothetical protein
MFCKTPIAECMGFVLARDFLALLRGEHIAVREICGKCVLGLSPEGRKT